MNKEDYKILKEIESLAQNIQKLEADIQSEEKRVHRLVEMQQTHKEELNETQDDLIAIQKKLLLTENEMDLVLKQKTKAENALDSAKNENEVTMSSKQKQQAIEKLEKLELIAMEELEKIDLAEASIKDHKNFLEGSQKTLLEIKQDVQEIITPKKAEQNTLNQRISLLKESIPKEAVDKYEKLTTKALTHGPLTKIANDHCYICKFIINKIDQKKIEQELKLKTCQGCSRIFIPNSTLY